jgi:GntR family transcriptional regulator, transcriptional repressor for pyruvate dehydrogenase complex
MSDQLSSGRQEDKFIVITQPDAMLEDEPRLAMLSPLDRVQQVSDAMVAYIGKADLKRGDRLPTERQLMQELGVGRSTVREVIGRFQALGVLESRKGSGTYLLQPVSAATVHMPLMVETQNLRDALLQTLEVRRGIEVEACALAAMRRTDEDLCVIEEKLDEMERVHLAKGTSGKEDLAFHVSIYEATHNPLFKQLLEQMREAFERFWDKPFDRPDFARRSFPYHRTLFCAIADRDSEGARHETLKILAVVEEDIKEMSK